MSDLFRTGPARRTSGSFTVSYSGAGDIVKRIQKLKDGGEVAIKRTVSDFTSRGPGWVSKGIREHYGVDTAAIKDAAKKPKRGRTSIRVAGISVDGATLEYKGRTLTPIHFKMSPKAGPSAQQKKPIRIPGQLIAGGSPVAMVRPPRKYTVKVTIIKGQRTAMSSDTFLTAGKGGAVLPYQRTGEGRADDAAGQDAQRVSGSVRDRALGDEAEAHDVVDDAVAALVGSPLPGAEGGGEGDGDGRHHAAHHDLSLIHI